MTIATVPYGEGSYGGDPGDHALSFLPVRNAYSAVSSPNIILRQISPDQPLFAPALSWDTLGQKRYEIGIDRGVLYLSNGSAVAWSGLTSVVENVNRDSSSVYFDGMKISALVSVGDYTGSMKAFTYPDEFLEFEGMGRLMDGVYLGDQPAQMFDLSYRTLVGNEADGNDAGYKIHVLFNVVAVPKDTTYATVTENLNLIEFEWDISAIQEEVDGHNPTAHIVINSLDVTPEFLQAVETVLYGDAFADPALPSLTDFITFLQSLSADIGTVLLIITDNGDGTWSATTSEDNLIVDNGDGTFDIFNANATFSGDSFDISNTVSN